MAMKKMQIIKIRSLMAITYSVSLLLTTMPHGTDFGNPYTFSAALLLHIYLLFTHTLEMFRTKQLEITFGTVTQYLYYQSFLSSDSPL
jgi:hypothetical protein